MMRITDPSRWEYKIIDDHHDGNPDSVHELNIFGAMGWELVAINKNLSDGSCRWYFKRPMGQSPLTS